MAEHVRDRVTAYASREREHTVHADELAIDETLVRRLLRDQVPALADEPLQLVRTTGTVNAVVRVGSESYVRLPRKPQWADDLRREARWLPTVAAAVSLAVPTITHLGEPTPEFGYPWAVLRWLPGRPYETALLDDPSRAALDLAAFVTQLRTLPIEGAPPVGRRPLAELDEITRQAIEECGDLIEAAAVRRAWDAALEAPVWDGRRVWIHGDLLPPNLLVEAGRLSAVIDFGAAGAGDPAGDVIAAWSVFETGARATYREALGVDDGTWARARGWVLHQALVGIPYYRETNPPFAAWGLATVDRVLNG